MKSLRWLDAALLAAFTALSRLAFRSHYLYDIDSVNFALALDRFAPAAHQPHPPGYFLYVYLGRLVNLLFHDANAALVAISIVFSCGAVAMIYVLAGNWFGRTAAIFAGLIFVVSPLAWFHGIVALTYIVEAFFSALTGYLCWRIYSGEARFVLPGAIAVGIAAGFRPSSLLLLGPLLMTSFRGVNGRQSAFGIGALALTLLGWIVPMVQIGGGRAYVSSLMSLWLAVPSRGMVFNSSIFNSFARACTIVGIYVLCFGCAAVLPAMSLRAHPVAERRKRLFTWAWLAPGLLFFTFIYLKFVNSGYLLLLAPPVCAWMGLWASTWYAGLRLRPALKILLVSVLATLNAMAFLYAPLYCSYGEVRRFELELETVLRALPQIASPRDTLIVGFDSHFLGYRHAGYYLPGYQTMQFPEVHLSSGIRVFAMRDRNTVLESNLAAAPIRKFVIFPLPLGDAGYIDYTAQVRKRFPPGALQIMERGGHEFAFGRAEDLGILFPVVHARRQQASSLVDSR